MYDSNILRPDPSLRGQYWERFTRENELSAEKRLLFGILFDAVKSYRTLVFKPGRRFYEVQAWLFDDVAADAFSFVAICDVLGMCPVRVRRAVRGYR